MVLKSECLSLNSIFERGNNSISWHMKLYLLRPSLLVKGECEILFSLGQQINRHPGIGCKYCDVALAMSAAWAIAKRSFVYWIF